MINKNPQKIINFIFCGLITAAFNIALIHILIGNLGFTTPLLRNLANSVAIEISLIFTFFVYKKWVWTKSKWKLQTILAKELPLFHLSAILTVGLRIFIIFPVIDWLGINYLINTLIGIGLGSVINYLACEKIVFNSNNN